MSDEFDPAPQSLVTWAMMALGPYGVLLAAAGMVSFIVSLMVVIRGRGPMASAALVLIVPLPLLIGVFGAWHGACSSFATIGMSGADLKNSELAAAISDILVRPIAGTLLMIPGYLIAAGGSFIRSMLSETKSKEAA